MGNIHSKSLTTNGLEHIVNLWGLQEAKVERLDVGKVGSELELDTHVALEGHVFDQDRHTGANDALADADGQHNLGVDLGSQLSWSHVLNVSGVELNTPVHQLCSIIAEKRAVMPNSDELVRSILLFIPHYTHVDTQ